MSAEAIALRIWADVQAGHPQPRPIDWPADEAVSAAGERVAVNDHCSSCRAAS